MLFIFIMLFAEIVSIIAPLCLMQIKNYQIQTDSNLQQNTKHFIWLY